MTSIAVVAGQTTEFNLTISGTPGFNGTVALTCTGAPASATCNVLSSPVFLVGTTPAHATVIVSTTGRSFVAPWTQLRPPAGVKPLEVSPGMQPLRFLWLALVLILGLVGAAWRGRERMRANPDGLRPMADVPLRLGIASVVLFAVVLAAASMPGCGGGGDRIMTGTPAGTYTLTVTGTVTSGSATVTHDIKLTLTVN